MPLSQRLGLPQSSRQLRCHWRAMTPWCITLLTPFHRLTLRVIAAWHRVLPIIIQSHILLLLQQQIVVLLLQVCISNVNIKQKVFSHCTKWLIGLFFSHLYFSRIGWQWTPMPMVKMRSEDYYFGSTDLAYQGRPCG